MRIANETELQNLPMAAAHKKTLAKAFKEQPSKIHTPSTGDGYAESKTSGTNNGKALQNQLWTLLQADDDLRQHPWESDFVGAVPGRRFEIDMALPHYRLGIELDGWLWHGKRKRDFLRDRDKDYALSLEGWQVFRLQAGLLYKDPSVAIQRIQAFLRAWLPRQALLFDCS